MNAEEFVDVVRKVVMDAAVDGVVSNLTHPPGRKPAPELLELSKWFVTLAADDRDMVRRALAEASHAAVFGLFAALDGARRVDAEQPPGETAALVQTS
jgi:hypothetical protein